MSMSGSGKLLHRRNPMTDRKLQKLVAKGLGSISNVTSVFLEGVMAEHEARAQVMPKKRGQR